MGLSPPAVRLKAEKEMLCSFRDVVRKHLSFVCNRFLIADVYPYTKFPHC